MIREEEYPVPGSITSRPVVIGIEVVSSFRNFAGYRQCPSQADAILVARDVRVKYSHRKPFRGGGYYTLYWPAYGAVLSQ
jgi:hypothetical protein